MLSLTEMQRQIKVKEWELYEQEQELRRDVESQPIEHRGVYDNTPKSVTFNVYEMEHNVALITALATNEGMTFPAYIRKLIREDLIAKGHEPSLEFRHFPLTNLEKYDYDSRLVRERLSFYVDEVPLTKTS